MVPCCSFLHHHLHEFLIVDLAIAVHVSLPDHLIHLLVCQLLPQVSHYMPQLHTTIKYVRSAVHSMKVCGIPIATRASVLSPHRLRVTSMSFFAAAVRMQQHCQTSHGFKLPAQSSS